MIPNHTRKREREKGTKTSTNRPYLYIPTVFIEGGKIFSLILLLNEKIVAVKRTCTFGTCET